MFEKTTGHLILRPQEGDRGVYSFRVSLSDGQGGEDLRVLAVEVIAAEKTLPSTLRIVDAVVDPPRGTPLDTFLVTAWVETPEGTPLDQVTAYLVGAEGFSQQETMKLVNGGVYTAEFRLTVGEYSLRVESTRGKEKGVFAMSHRS